MMQHLTAWDWQLTNTYLADCMNPKIAFPICHLFMTYFPAFGQVCHFHIDFSFVQSQQLLQQTKLFYGSALVWHLSDNEVDEYPTTMDVTLNVDIIKKPQSKYAWHNQMLIWTSMMVLYILLLQENKKLYRLDTPDLKHSLV